jgi:hypothetical protein
VRLGQRGAVPLRPVLVRQPQQAAVGVDPGRPPCVGHQQQRVQSVRVGAVRHQLPQHPGQVHRPVDEVGPDQRRARRRGVPGGEQQVDDRQRRAQPVRQFARGRYPVRDSRDRDLPLGPGDPRRHRRLRDQERPGDVWHRNPAHQPQGQRHLGLLRQRGVAADEDQAEPLVRQRRPQGVFLRFRALAPFSLAGWRSLAHRAVGRSGGLNQQRQPRAERGVASYFVDRAPPGGRGQPGGGIVGDAVGRPRAQRRRVGLLHAVLGQVEVADDAHRGGEHPGPLAAVRVGDGRLDASGVCHLRRV